MNSNPLLSLAQNINMTKDFLSRNRWGSNQLLPEPNQNTFPVPPTIQDGLLPPPPNQLQNNYFNNNNNRRNNTAGILDVPGSKNSMMGRRSGDHRQVNSPMNRMNSRQSNNNRSPRGLLNIPGRNVNRINQEQHNPNNRNQWSQSNNNRNMRKNDGSSQDNNKPFNNSPRNLRSSGPNQSSQNTSYRFPANLSAPNSSSSLPLNKTKPRNNPVYTTQAIKKDVSLHFYDEVMKRKGNDFAEICLEAARTEYLHSKGEDVKKHLSSGIGHHSCDVCKMKFLSKDKLANHYMTLWHKELDELFQLKKEQAVLIIQSRIRRPKEPVLEMMSIEKAELEMNLKPKDVDLDSYILGIYESVMKPYWPVPKSVYYCRICNYAEFRNSDEMDVHKQTKEHLGKEESYEKAFCLYCQVHTGTASNMGEHKKTDDHCKILDLMERTKQCAFEHWHKENNLELPVKYQKNSQSVDAVVGEKRSASALGKVIDKGPKRPATQDPANDSSFEPAAKRDNVTKKGDSALTEHEKLWFVPMTGVMCVACRVFIASEREQDIHAKQSDHLVHVSKMKSALTS